jgi:DNA-binding transcriptional ArsR family regulator
VSLQNLWHLFNLRESPYFQQDLQPGGSARYPLSLFVGREREAERMLSVIAGSATSRQTLEGPPGFGKTTLAQHLKASAAEDGYVSYPDPVSASGADSVDTLLVRLLSYVYDALASQANPDLLKDPGLETARRIIRDVRTRDVKVAATVGGFGFDRAVTERTEPAPFHSGLLSVPRLLQDLSRTARAKGYRGIILHLNNLVGEAERARTSDILRDLRDVFLLDGYHFLLVGTSDAVRALISPHAQLRSVFGIGRPLAPLSLDDFQALLARRYRFLGLDQSAPVRPPVAHDATRSLYGVYRGDLRGTLRALDAGAHELIGYTDPPGAPIQEAELMAVLAPLLSAETEASLSPKLLDYFYSLAKMEEPFTQAGVAVLWGLTQGSVSQWLRELQRHGYVKEASRQGRQILYELTGPARIVLGRSG